MKKRNMLCLIIILCVLAVVAVCEWPLLRMIYCAITSPNRELTESELSAMEEWDGGRSIRNIRYADDSDSQYLNLYIPEPEGEKKPPLIILVHGGGFIVGDAETKQVKLMYRYFRDHGYACATINYRLAQEAPFPAAVSDVKAAIRFLKAKESEYGYECSHTVVWGESAGGYLAAMSSLTDDDTFTEVRFLGEEELAEQVSGHVDALIDYYGVSDLELLEKDYLEERVPGWVLYLTHGWVREATDRYRLYAECWLDKDMSAWTEEDLRMADIRPHVGETENIRVFLTHGDGDFEVHVNHSERLSEKLTGVYGEDAVTYRRIPRLVHADDRFYTDEFLDDVRTWIEK